MEFGKSSIVGVLCEDRVISLDDLPISKDDVKLLHLFFQVYQNAPIVFTKQEELRLQYLDLYLDIPLIEASFNVNYKSFHRLIHNECSLIPETCYNQTNSFKFLSESIKKNDFQVFKHLIDFLMDEESKYKEEACIKSSFALQKVKWFKNVAEYNRLDMAKYLFQKGNQNFGHMTKIGALFASFGNIEAVQWAYDNGFPLDIHVSNAAAYGGFLSLLEFLHERECPWNVKTMHKAALKGHLDVIKYLQRHQCPWNSTTVQKAVMNGHLHIVKYLHEQGCPWDEDAFCAAAMNGHLAIVEYLHDQGCPYDVRVTAMTACAGHLSVLKYLFDHGYAWDKATCAMAASGGHLSCLAFAHENGCPWDAVTCYNAVTSDHVDCLRYAVENHCPMNSQVYRAAVRHESTLCLVYLEKLKQEMKEKEKRNEFIDMFGS
jgi:hypothetical protein